jgi:glutathione S-transferase
VRIYDAPELPNPRRVRIFLAEKGIDVPFVKLDPRDEVNDEAWFREKNPIGAVPVLELDDGTCIAESLAICQYFETLHPEPRLLGEDPLDRTLVRTWQRRIEWRVFRFASQALIALIDESHPFFNVNRAMRLPEWGRTVRQLAADYLTVLDRELATRRFVANERFTVADITLWVSLEVASHTDLHIGEQHHNLRRWYDDVSSRGSVR